MVKLQHNLYGDVSVSKSEFEKYIIVQDRLFESDFDRLLKESDTVIDAK